MGFNAKTPGAKARGRARIYTLNHTNSFLDPVVFAVQQREPLHFLARGDVLHGFAWGVLPRLFPLLPVWRQREGQVHLKDNFSTFERCFEVWKKGGSVVIFSEGLCENRPGLKPLLKGTARLVWQAHARGLDLEVVPVGVCYEHYRGTGKGVRIDCGEPIQWRVLADRAASPALFYQSFNALLARAMADRMLDPQETGSDTSFWRGLAPRSRVRRGLRLLNRWLHQPLWLPVRALAARLTRGTVHFDSIYFVLLMLTYPLWLLLLLGFGVWCSPGIFPSMAACVLLLPALARLGR